jgi:hypothetical protein
MYARQVKFISPRGYNEIRNGLLGPRSGACVVDVGRADPSDPYRTHPQPVHTISAPIHSLYTRSGAHPQSVHTMLMPLPADPPVRCRPMGQTPIYDQLRGERINAEVPATGADLQRADHPGKHHLVGAPVPGAVFRPESASSGKTRVVR